MWPQTYEALSTIDSVQRSTNKVIACEENNCRYVANNPDQDDVLRIKPDKDIPPDGNESDKRIDILLLNETKKTAYLVELKRSDVNKAYQQLENTDKRLTNALRGYKKYWRIVHASRTTRLIMNKFRVYKQDLAKRNIDFKMQNTLLEENI